MIKFIRRVHAAYRFAKDFDFTEADLPPVREDVVSNQNLPDKRRIKYYAVGRWNMEVIDPDPNNYSDSNPEYARDALLAWMSWWRFLNDRPKRERKPTMSWGSAEALVGASRGNTLRDKIAHLRGQ